MATLPTTSHSRRSPPMKLTLTFLTLAAALLAMACGGNTEASSVSPQASAASVARGKYLVTVMGCNDCHTPFTMGPNGPEPDMSRMLSGHPEQIGKLTPARLEEPYVWASVGTNTAFSGPWGISYTANLT